VSNERVCKIVGKTNVDGGPDASLVWVEFGMSVARIRYGRGIGRSALWARMLTTDPGYQSLLLPLMQILDTICLNARHVSVETTYRVSVFGGIGMLASSLLT